jgi:hypothetical protein
MTSLSHWLQLAADAQAAQFPHKLLTAIPVERRGEMLPAVEQMSRGPRCHAEVSSQGLLRIEAVGLRGIPLQAHAPNGGDFLTVLDAAQISEGTQHNPTNLFSTLFVTGEARHHDQLAAKARGCDLLLGGHSQTERGYLPTLAASLKPHLPGVSLVVSRADAPPFRMA